ncbi:MAG TPA: hypothetical protein VG520_04770 [Candidatus Dormibacteraeota bacterium]|jgi:hypothetical protein|nr:hypothetical protein [Candidatus Dormibacteraeota bacterium]
MDDLSDWRGRFEAGRLKPIGLRQPKMEPGERFAVRITSVGTHEQDLAVPLDQWSDQPGSGWRGWSHAPLGALFATSERAFVVGNSPRDVRREWRWRDQASVALLPVALGVAIRRDPAASAGDVVASEWNQYVVASAPDKLKLMVRWLKVEAAYAAYRGGLDKWFAGLEARLAHGV